MGEPPMVFALCCLRANLFRTHHPSTLYVPTVLRSRRILRSSSWIQKKKPAGNYKSCNLSATCLQAGDHYLGGPWNFVNDIAMIINGCFGPVTILSKLLENGYLGFFTCMKLHSGPDSYPDNPRRAPLWSCTKPLRSSSGTWCIHKRFDPGTWERLSKSQGYLGHTVKVTRAMRDSDHLNGNWQVFHLTVLHNGEESKGALTTFSRLGALTTWSFSRPGARASRCFSRLGALTTRSCSRSGALTKRSCFLWPRQRATRREVRRGEDQLILAPIWVVKFGRGLDHRLLTS